LRFDEKVNMPALQAQEVLEDLIAGNLENALMGAKALVERDPSNAEVLHIAALAHAKVRDFDVAYKYFEKSLSLRPNNVPALINFSTAYRDNREFKKALQYAKKALNLDPKIPEIYVLLGGLFLDTGLLGKAAATFKKGIELSPQNSQLRYNLGATLQRGGKPKEAAQLFNEILESNPAFVDAYFALANIAVSNGDLSSARKLFNQAITYDPLHRKSIDGLARISEGWVQPLVGRYLELTRQSPDDAIFLSECLENAVFLSQYNRYLPFGRDAMSIKNGLEKRAETHPNQNGAVEWIIRTKVSGDPIGLASLVDINLNHQRAEFLLGIPDYADRKVGTSLEASLLVLDFAFNRVGLNKLNSLVYSENLHAQKSTLGLGFKQEAYFESHIRDIESGKYKDVLGYGMTAEMFRRNSRLQKLSLKLLHRDITQR